MSTPCTICGGKRWLFVEEWIGPLQGRKDCTCVPVQHIAPRYAVTCTTWGKELDKRDDAQCFGHGLPVPDTKGKFFCLTTEEIEQHRNGVFKKPLDLRLHDLLNQ